MASMGDRAAARFPFQLAEIEGLRRRDPGARLRWLVHLAASTVPLDSYAVLHTQASRHSLHLSPGSASKIARQLDVIYYCFSWSNAHAEATTALRQARRRS
jgi:hypothetical protein